MNQTPRPSDEKDSPASDLARQGLMAAIVAYLMWGFMPLYFRWVVTVPALEMLAHRVIWAVPFGLLIVIFRRQLGAVLSIFRTPAHLGLLAISGGFIALNWLVYILAVQHQQVYQASLGYYINPLMYVVVGVWFFHETLSRPQWLAVVLATIGVAVLVVSGGQVPWYALGLAVSFTVYGVVRKQVAVGAMPGLLVETLLLSPFAVGYMLWLASNDQMVFLHTSTQQNIGMMLGGPLTVLPLLFFSIAARRLTLSAIGFLQFMAPTIQFFLALSFG
ncbi:MAG: EamA family transporter RarD, partial [Lysobacterales bacterium]